MSHACILELCSGGQRDLIGNAYVLWINLLIVGVVMLCHVDVVLCLWRVHRKRVQDPQKRKLYVVNDHNLRDMLLIRMSNILHAVALFKSTATP